ncbi:MAG: AAA family ATPase [Corynebacterium sp.]|uniref:ATP-dependent nuclease n=1 Tax=unclassified Corynebacterium TaxID=2624378 RepID=UPI000A3DEF8F|nr:MULTISPECIES: AAA family ATPase [unclassified Corynebacterium]MDU1463066.1 AAA family ATPase [Corynebacterium sp.]
MRNNADHGVVKPTITKIQIGEVNICLKAGTVTALVGPNNSGKSHFLDQLEAQLAGVDSAFSKQNEGLITRADLQWQGRGHSSEESCASWASENLTISRSGRYEANVPEHFASHLTGLNRFLGLDEVQTIFSGASSLGCLVGYFVRRDSPLNRVQESYLKDLKEDSLAKRVWQDDAALKKVTEYFNEVFGEPLSVYDIGEGTIGYKIAPASEKMPRIGESYSSHHRAEMDGHPKAWQQGLGMQSVLGILLALFADDRPIVLLDEPEAFLHPPQAHRLGQILRKVAEQEGRQIFCATHDKNLLSGLAGGEKETLSIIRLQRTVDDKGKSKYSFSLIPPTFNEDIRDKSRIRHTHLLDGLFSDAVIIVENEKDAYFFSEALESLAEELRSSFQPSSICFVGVGGKNNVPSTFELLRSMTVPTVIVADTDFIVSENRLHSGGPFSKVLKETGARNKNDLISLRNEIEDLILAEKGSELKDLPEDKYEGRRKKLLNNKLNKLGLNPPLLTKVEQLNEKLTGTPLCLVPGGQLEDLEPEVSGHGTDWVRKAINKRAFENEATKSFMDTVLQKVRVQIDSQS